MLRDAVGPLKNLARTGWMLRGIPSSVAETVASHSFEVAYITLILIDAASVKCSVDPSRALKMAILHDVPESLTGDLVKWSKDRLTDRAKGLDEESLRAIGLGHYLTYLKELETLRTAEAVIVKIADNLATELQGRRYLYMGYPGVEDIVEGNQFEIEELLKKEAIASCKEEIEGAIEGLRRAVH